MMIARTSGRSTSSIASGIARSIAWLIALRFSGRLSAMYAISPSTRTLIAFSAMTETSIVIEGIAHPRAPCNRDAEGRPRQTGGEDSSGFQQYLHHVVFAGVEDFIAFGGIGQRQYVAYQG